MIFVLSTLLVGQHLARAGWCHYETYEQKLLAAWRTSNARVSWKRVKRTHARIRRRKTVERLFERHTNANYTRANTSTVADQLNSGKTRDGTKEMTNKTCRHSDCPTHMHPHAACICWWRMCECSDNKKWCVLKWMPMLAGWQLQQQQACALACPTAGGGLGCSVSPLCACVCGPRVVCSAH